MSISDRLLHAWNAFTEKDKYINYNGDSGYSYFYRPDRVILPRGHEKTIITSIFNRISIDSASISMQHARVDNNGRFLEAIDSGLNNCLTLEANIDQTGRAFIQDAVMSLLSEGSVALIPVDTSFDPKLSNAFDILSLRTGKVVEWHPSSIKVSVYNDKTGKKEDITVPKSMAAIVESPLYSVINEPNSTMQRLIRKLNLLDVVDEQSGSGKLDMVIQLPYAIKTDNRRHQAELRRTDMEQQLANSKYGIAYIDSTEKITQLNRSVDNNLMSQIQYLTTMLYSQLGINSAILDGTATPEVLLNYFNTTIEPILAALAIEMKRKFITKTARTQGQTIIFFNDPFKIVPIDKLSDISDSFTRNEILSSNEVRQLVGFKPSKDPKADELRNKNLNVSKEQQ